jgi:hypothetical protein
MLRRGLKAVPLGMAVIVSVLALSGCSSLPRVDAVEIVVWQQQERDRLEAQGFPQYNSSMD